MKKYTLGISIALAYGTALIGSFFTAGSVDTWYTTLSKPPLNPPGFLFGPVWTLLYTLMAVSAWRIYEKRKKFPSAPFALGVYGVHLFINAFWSVAFFGLHSPLLSLGVIVVLLASIIFIGVLFYRIDTVAGVLFIPYVLWVLFATYLNTMIVLLNY